VTRLSGFIRSILSFKSYENENDPQHYHYSGPACRLRLGWPANRAAKRQQNQNRRDDRIRSRSPFRAPEFEVNFIGRKNPNDVGLQSDANERNDVYSNRRSLCRRRKYENSNADGLGWPEWESAPLHNKRFTDGGQIRNWITASTMNSRHLIRAIGGRRLGLFKVRLLAFGYSQIPKACNSYVS
jgi:hypothetical protein